MTHQKKKNDVQQQLHWGKFVSQREVGKLKRQENLCLNDFPPKKKKKLHAHHDALDFYMQKHFLCAKKFQER